MEGLLVNGILAIVQTYDEGGWDVFTPSLSNDIDATIADALTRCRVPAQSPAAA